MIYNVKYLILAESIREGIGMIKSKSLDINRCKIIKSEIDLLGFDIDHQFREIFHNIFERKDQK